MLKKKSLLIFLGVLVFIASLLFYGYAIETKSQRLHVSAPKLHNLPVDFKNVKVSYIADPLIGKNYSVTAFQSVAKTISEERPDIIIFSGELLSHDMTNNLYDEQVATILQKMEAPLGKFSLSTFYPNTQDLSIRADELLKRGGFTSINNQSRHIYNHSLTALNIIGLNEALSVEDATQLLKSAQDTPSILITTSPNNFELARSQQNIALTLASGTFGGLINFPLINKSIVKDVNGDSFAYTRGYYLKNEAQQLLVNAGLGTPDNFPIRLFNRPTVYTISLQTTLTKDATPPATPEEVPQEVPTDEIPQDAPAEDAPVEEAPLEESANEEYTSESET